MKTTAFALFFIVINCSQRLLEGTNTNCNLDVKKVTKEGSDEVSFDVKLDCNSTKDGKEIAVTKTKHCASGEKFSFVTFKRVAQTPDQTPD